ncbi:hypothetical protein I3F57_06155 [Lacticaseibacillus paracasei subsp. tolerans]|uniref:phage minor capsid protein n=1 Tax=Lacticaseibacillus paracasei TaxID=1597 RepID=UPI0018AD4ECB|nr:phage minor capsid protein [Lacticaseibacillus paracasei]QPI89325.1 hypothetical protein I3F57_06155 [Lacticaseibacillus paracasei subsp. tolerans]
MALRPWDLDELSDQQTQRVAMLEDTIWAAIVNTLASKGSYDQNQPDPDDWKEQLLSYAPDIRKYASKISAKPMGEAIKQSNKAIASAPIEDWRSTDSKLEALAKRGVIKQPAALDKSKAVSEIVNQAQTETTEYLAMARKNMTKHSYETFRKIVSDASLSVRTGTEPRQAMFGAASKWAEKGIPAMVDSAGRRWQPDTYLRMVINNQVKQTSNSIAIQRAKDYGSYVKVSSHLRCRPTHLQYQGRIYSVSSDSIEYPDLYQTTNYGSAGGLCGINCHHYVMPYVPGYYEQTDHDTIDEQDNNEAYALTQEQRRLERQVRAAKRVQLSAKTFGDEPAIKRANRLVSNRQTVLRDFISANKKVLSRQYDREKPLVPSGYVKKQVEVLSSAVKAQYNVIRDKYGDKAPSLKDWRTGVANGFKAEDLINHATRMKPQAKRVQREELNADGYNKHVPGTPEYENYRQQKKRPISELIISSDRAQQLIDQYTKGKEISNVRTLSFEANTVIGYFLSVDGKRWPTQFGRISFSKTGAHITPLKPS